MIQREHIGHVDAGSSGVDCSAARAPAQERAELVAYGQTYLAAAGAIACAGRKADLVCAVMRQSLIRCSARLVHRGLQRLGVKRIQRVEAN